MLTILIGMSASGKDAILRELVANHGFREIVTTTTRPMRKGEVNGKDYNCKEYENLLRNLSKREPYPDFDIEKGLKHIQLF